MQKLPYLGAALSAAWYAWWLEQREKKYHPDVTWKNVLRGIALTGLWVAVRITLGAPRRDTWPWRHISSPVLRGAVWAWFVTLRMFVATGVPVVVWEEAMKGERGRRLLAYVREARRGNQAPTTGD